MSSRSKPRIRPVRVTNDLVVYKCTGIVRGWLAEGMGTTMEDAYRRCQAYADAQDRTWRLPDYCLPTSALPWFKRIFRV